MVFLLHFFPAVYMICEVFNAYTRVVCVTVVLLLLNTHQLVGGGLVWRCGYVFLYVLIYIFCCGDVEWLYREKGPHMRYAAHMYI